jgi:hypothetical protein
LFVEGAIPFMTGQAAAPLIDEGTNVWANSLTRPGTKKVLSSPG